MERLEGFGNGRESEGFIEGCQLWGWGGTWGCEMVPALARAGVGIG